MGSHFPEKILYGWMVRSPIFASALFHMTLTKKRIRGRHFYFLQRRFSRLELPQSEPKARENSSERLILSNVGTRYKSAKMLRLTVSRPTMRRENLVHSQSPKSKESSFSNRQFGILPALPRGHKSTDPGRNQAACEASEISFHSLRHSAVTMLKAAGVSDFIAREIVGHESAAVSRQYTHLTTDDKRAAMRRLPDMTNT